MHYAILGHIAAKLIVERADSTKEQRNLLLGKMYLMVKFLMKMQNFMQKLNLKIIEL